MGAGKTTVGQRLARRLGWEFLDLDRVVEERAGRSIPEIFQAEGESGFRQRERFALLEVSKGSPAVLACGGGTPCLPGFSEAVGGWGRVVFLDVDLAVLEGRVEGKGRPLWGADVDQLLRVRRPFYLRADLVVDGSDVPERVVDAIVAGLRLGDAS